MLPLRVMQMMQHASGGGSGPATPVACEVLGDSQFERLVGSQPWCSVRSWKQNGYQCAVCEKAA